MLKQFTTHSLMALAEASLIALLVVGLIAGTAFAGKGRRQAQRRRRRHDFPRCPQRRRPNAELGRDGDVQCIHERLEAICQPEVLSGWCLGVLRLRSGYFPGAMPWDQFFILRNTTWSSGAADCTAKLYTVNSRGTSVTLATMSFHVAP